MTASLNEVAVQEFRDQFQRLYQAPRQITGTTLEVHGVVGDAYKWPQMGEATMIPRGASSSAVPASDVTHPRITTNFFPFVLNTPTDRFDQAEVNADEMSSLAIQHVKAIGRREDQFVIDALDVSGANTIVAGGTNLTFAKLREASADLNAANVDMEDRTILIHANGLRSLLNEAELTNSDFNTVKTLVSGQINTFMGFKFVMIGDRPKEGGLPKTGDIRTCFVYNKMAMGMVWQIDPQVRVVDKPELISQLTISHFSAGASALQIPGIVKIDCDETVI